jgi:hypothetical protein
VSGFSSRFALTRGRHQLILADGCHDERPSNPLEARLGAKVVIVGRNPAKAAEVITEISN